MNGFDRRREGSAESGNIELAPAPGASSSEWTWLTKSLYWAVGLHAGWDWFQSYL
jgi:hypothetical protein